MKELAMLLALAGQAESVDLPASRLLQLASTTCYLSGQSQSGFNRICYYDCLGSTFALTIKSTQLCPLTVRQ